MGLGHSVYAMVSILRSAVARCNVSLVLTATLALTPFSVFSAPVVVLSSTSSEFMPGDIRDSADVVSLATGQMLLLNDAGGKTRELVGPYDGPLGGTQAEVAGGSDIIGSLSRLAAARGELQSKVGAVRGDPTLKASSPDLISVGQFGAQCVETGDQPTLWRSTTGGEPVLMRIYDIENETSVDLVWPPGDQQLPWPSALPPSDGGRYWVYWPMHETVFKAIEIQFTTVGQQPSRAARAATMEQAGCQRQALLLFEEMVN